MKQRRDYLTIFFLFYALFILFIFNSLTYKLCVTLEITNRKRQAGVFRVINIMILILLVSSYFKVINSMLGYHSYESVHPSHFQTFIFISDTLNFQKDYISFCMMWYIRY